MGPGFCARSIACMPGPRSGADVHVVAVSNNGDKERFAARDTPARCPRADFPSSRGLTTLVAQENVET